MSPRFMSFLAIYERFALAAFTACPQVKLVSSRCLALTVPLSLALSACGGGGGGGNGSGSSYTIGGHLAGLPTGQQVTLRNNASDLLTLLSNGQFTFTRQVPAGSNYSVTINQQPFGGTCVVTNGSGAAVNSNVSNITVQCSTDTYAVGGNLRGLAVGERLTLQNNGVDSLALAANGAFVFPARLMYGDKYDVSISMQPNPSSKQFCIVENGSGNISQSITDVQVLCNTKQILHGYTSADSAGGQYPNGPLTMDAAGNLYGTTSGGGTGLGVVFKLSPIGGGIYGETVVSTDLAAYGGLVADSSGNLYGTTQNSVFKLTPASGGGYSASILHFFAGTTDGRYPGGLMLLGNTLFGTSKTGGTHNRGIVFSVSITGSDYIILHNFSGSDGAQPNPGLVRDRFANIYGTTEGGGRSDFGTVFKLTLDASGVGYTESVIHLFSGIDGAIPEAGLAMDSNFGGMLYGTTRLGGAVVGVTYGTVFSLSTLNGTFTTLHTFTSGRDGAEPLAALLKDNAGNLYGTTGKGGGSANCPEGCGTVFKLSAAGGSYSVLRSFMGGSDGAAPDGLIMDSAGNLYGTTSSSLGAGMFGGTDNGNAFEIVVP